MASPTNEQVFTYCTYPEMAKFQGNCKNIDSNLLTNYNNCMSICPDKKICKGWYKNFCNNKGYWPGKTTKLSDSNNTSTNFSTDRIVLFSVGGIILLCLVIVILCKLIKN
jgi:hypothetical protein